MPPEAFWTVDWRKEYLQMNNHVIWFLITTTNKNSLSDFSELYEYKIHK